MTTRKNTKPRRQMPKPGSKTQAILTLAATTPARPCEIAESVNSSAALVSQVMVRYGIIPNTADSFKNPRADIMAGIQERILASIKEADITDASLLQRVTSTGILYDKERAERGLAGDDKRPILVVIRGEGAHTQVNLSTGGDKPLPAGQVIDIVKDNP